MQHEPTWQGLRPILVSLEFELRNTLCVVRGYAELVQEKIAASKPISAEVSQLRESAERCSAIEKRLHDLIRDPRAVIAEFNRC